jgi:hypothetical protein
MPQATGGSLVSRTAADDGGKCTDHSRKLESLARECFPDLRAAEVKLLRAAPRGQIAICGPNDNKDDPANDPSRAAEWDPDREIRSQLLRWLCVDRVAKEYVDPKGVQLFGAKLMQALDLEYVTIPFGLSLWRCRLTDFTLHSMELPELDLQGSWADTIQADRIKVHGSVFLRNGFRAENEIRLLGAQIDGDLDCTAGTFLGRRQVGRSRSGKALSAERARVTGNVFLRDGFRAEGDVSLGLAQIGGDLDCTAGYFTKLSIQSAVIKSTIFWMGIIDPDRAQLDLEDAAATFLVDEGKSWPVAGNLTIEGFVYQSISGGPRLADQRLDWLARQCDFSLQPYRQLATVLQNTGDEDGARRVLVQMEYLRRRSDWTERPWSYLLKQSVGYGYYPTRAAWALLMLTGLGWIIFRRAQLAGAICPTDQTAYSVSKDCRYPPTNYGRFSPLIYSLENSLPLVRLGETDRWHPNPATKGPIVSSGRWVSRLNRIVTSPTFLQRFVWIQILLGWLFATLFAAGVTGVIHK